MSSKKQQESDLYPAIKSYLENIGYEVKGEIVNCDVVAKKGDEVVIIELKLTLNLTLLLQAMDRFSLTDIVYIAIPKQCTIYKKQHKQIKKLVKRLGIGLMVIDMQPTRHYVEVIFDPQDYTPRQNKRKQGTLLKEFTLRQGDTQKGGSTRQKSGLTAYRQRCIRVAEYLIDNPSAKGSDIKNAINEPQATQFLAKDYYGWFDKVERGIYQLTEKGKNELPEWQLMMQSYQGPIN
ncbi:hypothetical protein CW745_12705 [Psychromonas sp. psych-6C06]|uniref:DUF2161 domain-containing phosphodiesterase n=1 Tax=Psychromonas sp. psych-6C06 TaxID=2058089 RepID=UPI000C31E43E|nr:DUF2161 domain-containing phosphodiesterase [Psychromonas sp. psych-6C06]PKF60730.1 hypothetical protein CW745_12705 [Psychromonas sp. psych-6C06]